MSDIFSQSNYLQFIHVFVKAAALAGNEVLAIYNEGDFNVRLKGDNSPLTRADIASHAVIRKELPGAFSDIPLMSEEGKNILYEERKSWDSYFCIDKSYYRGITGDLIWTSLSVLALNIRKLLRDLDKRPSLLSKLVLKN